MLKNLKSILAFSLLLMVACNSDSEVDSEQEDEIPRHEQFRENRNFIIRGFNYEKSNKKGLEGIDRSDEELLSHKPVLTASDEGRTITISFPDLPNKKNHFLEWIELVDSSGEKIYSNIDKLDVDQETYEIALSSEKRLKFRVRIRYYCYIHGEFVQYVDLAAVKKKTTILDRQRPE